MVVRISGRTFEIRKNVHSQNFRVIRKLRSHPQKSYKNHIKSYENHIKSYKNNIKSYENHIKSFGQRSLLVRGPAVNPCSKSGKNIQIQKNGSSENFGGSRNFRSNVRISGRTFEIRKNVQIQKNGSSEN